MYWELKCSNEMILCADLTESGIIVEAPFFFHFNLFFSGNSHFAEGLLRVINTMITIKCCVLKYTQHQSTTDSIILLQRIFVMDACRTLAAWLLHSTKMRLCLGLV